MKNMLRIFGVIALMATVGFSMMGCDQVSDPGATYPEQTPPTGPGQTPPNGGPGSTLITWTAAPFGNPSTTAIDFTFSRDPGSLTVGCITIGAETGFAMGEDLTGSGTTRRLTISDVSAGTVLISIFRAEFAEGSQEVTLVVPIITWTANPVGDPTNHIEFTFSADPGELDFWNFTITPGTGSAFTGTGSVSGMGNTRTLAVFGASGGDVSISIESHGINSEPQAVTIAGPVLINWTANPVGRPTNSIEFTFTEDPGEILFWQLTITSGTGSASAGILSGTGTRRTLTLSSVVPGTVTISISNVEEVNSHPQEVVLAPPHDITWTATPVGTANTSSIRFDFDANPGNLTAANFTITDGTGSATRGLLTREVFPGVQENRWILAISNVSAGTVSVSIDRVGIESGPRTVTLVRTATTPQPPNAWTASPSGSPTTTSIIFSFDRAPTGLTAGDITIASGSGSATRGALSGSGNTRTLAVSNVSAGTVSVSINRTGIVAGPQTVTLVAPGAAPPPVGTQWQATPVGSPTTNTIAFSFGANVPTLLATDITITSGTGSATRGTLSGSGNIRNLTISNVTPGTVTIQINRTGIDSSPQTVTLDGITVTTITITDIPAGYNGRGASVALLNPTTGAVVATGTGGAGTIESRSIVRAWSNRSGNYIVRIIILTPGGGQNEYRTAARNISAGNITIPWSGNFFWHQ